jgi:hypothetical protein
MVAQTARAPGLASTRWRILRDVAVLGNLSEHLERVKPRLHLLEADLVIDRGDRDALELDRAAMRLDADLFALAVEGGTAR